MLFRRIFTKAVVHFLAFSACDKAVLNSSKECFSDESCTISKSKCLKASDDCPETHTNGEVSEYTGLESTLQDLTPAKIQTICILNPDLADLGTTALGFADCNVPGIDQPCWMVIAIAVGASFVIALSIFFMKRSFTKKTPNKQDKVELTYKASVVKALKDDSVNIDDGC